MKIKLEQEILDTMSKDTDNWKGPFYYNKKDPRLIVPKFNPLLGMTLNFASKYVYITIICIFIIVIASKFL